MELKHLYSFAALAEELHFGRAAKRLQITQSALSQQLQRLESSLGSQLVVRTSREVSLTEAGQALLDPALSVLAASERARSAVGDIGSGRGARLRITSLGAGLNGPLPRILSRYHRAVPSSIVELHHSSDGTAQEQSLITGEFDAAIVRRIADHRLITVFAVAEERFVVCLPASHRLADRSQVGLSELRDEDFVFWKRRLGPSFHDTMVDACQAHGFLPRIAAYADTLESQLALVAAGFGLLLQVETNSSITRAGTVIVPIADEDVRSSLWLAYLATNRSPAMRVFLDSAQEERAVGAT